MRNLGPCETPYMSVKEIKNELHLNKKSHVGAKMFLWERLIDIRCENAIIQNDEKPFGGPALERLLDTVYQAKWYMTNLKNKGLMRKEIAGHIANYPELPTYFGKKMYCLSQHKECIFCKEICLCNSFSPPRSALKGHWTWTSQNSKYQTLQNLWSEARKEWEIMQEPARMKEAKKMVESAPLVNAILPCEICDLIAEKLVLSYYEEPYEKLESKKLTARILNESQIRYNESKISMIQSKNRLSRCGKSTREKAYMIDAEVIYSPAIKSRMALLEIDYKKKLNEHLIIEKEHESLMNNDVGFSVRTSQWVPI